MAFGTTSVDAVLAIEDYAADTTTANIARMWGNDNTGSDTNAFQEVSLGGAFTGPDVSFFTWAGTGGGNRNTSITMSFSTPQFDGRLATRGNDASGTGVVVGIQTVGVLLRKISGNQNPNYSITLTDSTTGNSIVTSPTTVTGSITYGITPTAGGITVVFEFDADTNTSNGNFTNDGSALEIQVEQTSGASGGNQNNKTAIEIGRVVWIFQTAEPIPIPPYNYAEII